MSLPISGIPLPRQIPFGALGIILAVFVQFVGLIVWASNEHNGRLELQHRFETYVADTEKRFQLARAELTGKNREQDEAVQRIEAQIVRIPVIEERATLVLQVLRDTQRSVSENAGALHQLSDLNRRNAELILRLVPQLPKPPDAKPSEPAPPNNPN